MRDGTDLIAEHFEQLTNGTGPCFSIPDEASSNWLPNGYEMVTDPMHILCPNDCILPRGTNDWRLVGNVNNGARVGLHAAKAGEDVYYIATPIQ